MDLSASHIVPFGEFSLPVVLDLSATFLWAISGALIGMHRRYDVLGVLILALVSSTGGGLIRDSIFLQQGPPVLVRDWRYLAVVALASMAVVVFGKHTVRVKPLIDLMDALGLGAYAVVGMTKSVLAGLSLPGIVLVGVANATGGALLRDFFARDELMLLMPGRYYAIASLVGCFAFILLGLFGVGTAMAAWITIAVTFLFRMLTIRFNWHTRPAARWTENEPSGDG